MCQAWVRPGVGLLAVRPMFMSITIRRVCNNTGNVCRVNAAATGDRARHAAASVDGDAVGAVAGVDAAQGGVNGEGVGAGVAFEVGEVAESHAVDVAVVVGIH